MNYSISEVGNLIGKVLDRFSRLLSKGTVLVMVITVLLQVFMRYFLKNPLVWGDELSKYSLVFMTFIGASVALRERQLAIMELVIEKLPNKIKKYVKIFTYLVSFVLLVFLFYYSVVLLNDSSVEAQLSPALQVPMKWIYFSMPLGLGMMIIQQLLLIISEFEEDKRKMKSGEII